MITRPEMVLPATSVARHSYIFVCHGQAFDLLPDSAGVVDKVYAHSLFPPSAVRVLAGCCHSLPRPLSRHLQSGFGHSRYLLDAHNMHQARYEHVDPGYPKRGYVAAKSVMAAISVFPGLPVVARSGATTGNG